MSKFPGDLLKKAKQALQKVAAQVVTDANVAAKDAKMAGTDVSNAAKSASGFVNRNIKSTGKDINKAGDFVGGIVSKLVHDAGDGVLAPLLPLKNGMKAAIKVAKYPDANPPDDTLNLAKEFVKKVIQNEQFESLEYFARARGASIHKSPIKKKSAVSAGGAVNTQASGTQAVNKGTGTSKSSGTHSFTNPTNTVGMAGGQANNNTLGSQAQTSGTTGAINAANQQNAANTALQNAALAAIQQAAAMGNYGSGGGGGGGEDDSSGTGDDSNDYSSDNSSDGMQSDQEQDNTFTASGGDDSGNIDYSQDDDMPGSSGGSDYSVNPDDFGTDDESDDDGSMDDGSDQFESLEKEEKYALGGGINSGYRDEYEEIKPGVLNFEDLEYLDGAGKKERALYLQCRDLYHNLSSLEAFESFESLSDSQAATIEGAASTVGAGIGTAAAPGVGTAIGGAIGAIVAAIIKWFQQAHDAHLSKTSGPTAQQAAAIAAANDQWNSMNQAQQNAAMGQNPFTNWFNNADGSKNGMHIFETLIGMAAIGLIMISLFNTD